MSARRRLAPRVKTRPCAVPSLGSLLATVRTHHPDSDLSLLEQAHDEAALWHAGQTRRNGDPFLTHCVAVAAIVADLGMPPAVVCAALLHDIEDTSCPPGRVAERFGQETADLISTVRTTRLNEIPPSALNLGNARPRPLQPTREEAVLAIRLADRLHNMRTITFVAPARQHRVARETLELAAPLAEAAGLDEVGRELHDISSAVLRPTVSAWAVTPRLLTVLTLLLPAPQRARWQEEWHAELATLPTRRARTRFTARILLSTPRLTLTLRHPIRQERW
ncbi:HD domain-containing protein [Streptomyces echinatus]|uniref:(P)ppGpp synthase/HD superfamily hydrolase n=1 Tax=Streptomyces echinatus TaxID=67293 RepID=A0A7W9UPK0_9ACTN|nr:HD domain-containing protein [Streptomyces echinatus]MBB5926448.1 (p)ppGpp synthase/HD superfamily hydrolase [Streptomyces echinatus]